MFWCDFLADMSIELDDVEDFVDRSVHLLLALPVFIDGLDVSTAAASNCNCVVLPVAGAVKLVPLACGSAMIRFIADPSVEVDPRRSMDGEDSTEESAGIDEDVDEAEVEMLD